MSLVSLRMNFHFSFFAPLCFFPSSFFFFRFGFVYFTRCAKCLAAVVVYRSSFALSRCPVQINYLTFTINIRHTGTHTHTLTHRNTYSLSHAHNPLHAYKQCDRVRIYFNKIHFVEFILTCIYLVTV